MISYVTKWHSRSYVLWSYVSFLLNPEQCICHLWVTKSLTLIFIIGVKSMMCHTELWHASIIIICVTVTRPMEPWSTEQRLIPVSTSLTSSVCNPITWCKTDSSQSQQYPVFIWRHCATVPTCPQYFPWYQCCHLSGSLSVGHDMVQIYPGRWRAAGGHNITSRIIINHSYHES